MFVGDVTTTRSRTRRSRCRGRHARQRSTFSGSRNAGVPYLESDYVFALVGEELGLVGMLLVLGLLVAFLWFGLRLVLSVRDRYEALVSFGLLVSVALQAMLHVQVVAGLAPPKGMTLPFISDGGTSLIVSSLAVGLALGAARRSSQEYLIHAADRTLWRYRASLSSRGHGRGLPLERRPERRGGGGWGLPRYDSAGAAGDSAGVRGRDRLR